jgi:ribonuclease HIII
MLCSVFIFYRGVEQWQLVGLITQRSVVRIHSPLPFRKVVHNGVFHFFDSQAMDRLQLLRDYLKKSGWSEQPGKPVPYGEQLIISDGNSEATLNYYPKRGKMVVGGPLSALRTQLEVWLTTNEPGGGAPASALLPAQPAQIGLDESGKGDWYGPLVVAAVYLDPAQAAQLYQAGVRDSKELERTSLVRLARLIEQTVAPGQRAVTALMPEQYNRRYADYGNINLLLAELYAETASVVWRSTKATTIVCDQFSQRVDRLNKAFSRLKLPQPEQLHHAEATSVAVAAASILASDRFVTELTQLGRKAGLRKSLPQGASALGELRQAAQFILEREGADGLGRYAKLNFRPVQALLGLADLDT